jgi:hypothetical protein
MGNLYIGVLCYLLLLLLHVLSTADASRIQTATTAAQVWRNKVGSAQCGIILCYLSLTQDILP